MFGSIDSMASIRSATVARRIVLGLSAAAGLFGLFRIGSAFLVDGRLRFGNPISGEQQQEESVLGTPPLSVKAEVTRVRGDSGVRPGQACDLFVERRPRAANDFECSAQVVCGGKLLYGGKDRGFFPCRFYEGDRRDVVGGEAETTRSDRDGALRIDTRQGILRVWDDATGQLGEFDIEAEVLSAQ
jgi:hypothetical protein